LVLPLYMLQTKSIEINCGMTRHIVTRPLTTPEVANRFFPPTEPIVILNVFNVEMMTVGFGPLTCAPGS